MTSTVALFLREWRIARRIGGGASVGAVFFLILVAIMPFALGPDLDLLARIGPAILWIAALLATLLGLDRLFQADHEDGSLDLLVNGPAAARIRGAGQMRRPLDGERAAAGRREPAVRADAGDGRRCRWRWSRRRLAAGTPALTMIGAIGAALTVSLRRGGLLMAVLVLPLTIPGADLRRRGRLGGERRRRRRSSRRS